MRLCRFESSGRSSIGFYFDDVIIPLDAVARLAGVKHDSTDSSLLPLLPGGERHDDSIRMSRHIDSLSDVERSAIQIAADSVALRVPVQHPGKLLLLAGNYAQHIEEGGGRAEERARTFPYVFMKPPATTLNHPGDPVVIPAVSPNHIDWELELGVIVGRTCHGVSERDALNYVAGYTVVNDISDRKFRPNPGRTERPKDTFFDWLHGKWHDTFCPMGPCVLPANELADPQTLRMTLRVNDTVEQDSSTAEMVFPVAAVIEFISSFVTLQPGDIISTGTPSGVGAAKNKFLREGDRMHASIQQIGTLISPVAAQ